MALYDRIRSRKQVDSKKVEAEQEVVELTQKIRAELLMEVQRAQWDGMTNEEVALEVNKLLEAFLGEQKKFLPKEERELLVVQVVQDMTGLGPIQPFLDDESVTEIMVNGPKQLWVERNGKLELTSHHFINDDHVMNVIEKIISPLGRRLDESVPMVDARLQDGSRFNAIIPPLAINGPTMTIRKFRKDSLGIPQLIGLGTMNKEIATFLELAVRKRMNILVSGGTGSGKTTLLNNLSAFIPHSERIVTIEDAAELQLIQPHVVRLETRPPNIESKGEISIRDLVRNSLRMRPDRIIIGEVRGGEALDMLQAMNTGHDGSLSTIHANTPRDMLSRLETLMLMAGYDLPHKALREQIASAIDLVIQVNRFPDGSRKITHITHIDGMENGVITLQDLFLFEETQAYQSTTVKGRFKQVGILPELNGSGRE